MLVLAKRDQSFLQDNVGALIIRIAFRGLLIKISPKILL